MRVAVVVPNLNQGSYLARTLESLFTQRGIDLRVAVVDGGSEDDSAAVIGRYESKLTYWRSQADHGQAAAINEGIEHLDDTEYVSWVNADDLILPGALARMASHLDAHPQSVAVTGKAHIIDQAGRVTGEYPARPFKRNAFARTCTVCQPASLIRRRAWEAIGGLDESLHMCLDYDLWWRLAKLGPIGFLDEFLACSRDHSTTKTRMRQDLLYQEVFPVLQRHLGYIPWRWCLSQTAYAWRVKHGGRRASDPLSQLICGLLATSRYFRMNGSVRRLLGLTRENLSPQ